MHYLVSANTLERNITLIMSALLILCKFERKTKKALVKAQNSLGTVFEGVPGMKVPKNLKGLFRL